MLSSSTRKQVCIVSYCGDPAGKTLLAESSLCKGTVQWKGIGVWVSLPQPVPVRGKIGKNILGPVKERGLYLESHIELVKTLKD